MKPNTRHQNKQTNKLTNLRVKELEKMVLVTAIKVVAIIIRAD